MGFVTRLAVTGDNDPEINPVSYYRHYAYCDRCASFRLTRWMEPADHARVEQLRGRLRQAAWLGSIAIVVLPFAPWLWPLVLLLVLGPAAGAAIMGRRIRDRGLICAECKATYEWGSAFFKDPKGNPRDIAAEAIPGDVWSDSEGSHFTYWVRGDTVQGPAAGSPKQMS